MPADQSSPIDQAALAADLIHPFYEGLDHLGKHAYFRTESAANDWRDAHGWDYVLETTRGRIWRATQKPTL